MTNDIEKEVEGILKRFDYDESVPVDSYPIAIASIMGLIEKFRNNTIDECKKVINQFPFVDKKLDMLDALKNKKIQRR